jgi:hypothetical protein
MSSTDAMGAPEHVTTNRTPQASRFVMFANDRAGAMQEHAMQAGIRAGKGPVQNRQRLPLCKEKAAEALDEAHQALVAERVEARDARPGRSARAHTRDSSAE